MKSNLTIFCLLLGVVLVTSNLFVFVKAQDETDDTPNQQVNATTKSPPPPTTTAIPTTTPSTKAPTKKQNCPEGCTCRQTIISCEGRKWKNLQVFKGLNEFNKFYLRNNSIEQVDFSLLPSSSIELLDLSLNPIKRIILPKKSDSLPKLKSLSLSSCQLNNSNDLSFLAKATALESLDLSLNPLEEIGSSTFNYTKNLRILKLNQTSLKTIHESAFWSLDQLRHLNMSGIRLSSALGNKQFINNQKLELVDMSNNELVEVPHSLRSTSAIATLILNQNLMTSLRRSDFINRTTLINLEIRNCPKLSKVDEFTFGMMSNLKVLRLSNNPRLQHFSKDAFKLDNNNNNNNSVKQYDLELIDLSNNNLTTLNDLIEFTGPWFQQILLNNNSWNCNCDLKWLSDLQLDKRSPVHCKTPNQYRDLEINNYFLTTDCDVEKSSYHTIIVTGFLLFLFGLAVAVFVQRSESFRRLFWKDQYGTIYYTKASFPPETV